MNKKTSITLCDLELRQALTEFAIRALKANGTSHDDLPAVSGPVSVDVSEDGLSACVSWAFDVDPVEDA